MLLISNQEWTEVHDGVMACCKSQILKEIYSYSQVALKLGGNIDPERILVEQIVIFISDFKLEGPKL